MKRHRISRATSARVFRKGAVNVHPLNAKAVPMRGGFRL